ncbi:MULTISPECIES: enoyl-CoA hydratase-related protein [unclassified Streptomyces]|uniref:enoyl-CoA hydratase-related protein n=1 Tax=unclassified Streptomyces TaxID=2593676 RepID=UPI002237E835|nr:enoyl-CoA hydratase-related protein [Streptomyces sp. SHP 1-2]MCW5253546.1 enoyl-CoA hydratase/isomerase family protein [Streptomyces sp. SHP 1-2]
MAVVDIDHPQDGVAIIRLNRPEVRNALNTEVRELLAAAVESLNADDTVGAIVLTGGDSVFAVGADLAEQADRDVVGAIRAYTHHAFWYSGKPVIAAVNGDAFGGGNEFILQCDFVVASESARFAQTEVTIGLVPGGGATQRLPRAIGRQNALYALLTGLPLSARDAHRLGYVSEVVEGDAVERAVELAALIASRPRLAVRQIKEVVRLGLDTSTEAGIALERRGYQLMFGTRDLREGFASVKEGRAPRFTGD